MNRITKLFQVTVNASAAFAALSIAVPAQSEQLNDGLPRVAINVQDSDFSSQAGIDALKKSAQRAARQVCFLESTTDLAVQMEQRACFDHAMSDATAQIDRRRASADARNNSRLGEGRVVESAANSNPR